MLSIVVPGEAGGGNVVEVPSGFGCLPGPRQGMPSLAGSVMEEGAVAAADVLEVPVGRIVTVVSANGNDGGTRAVGAHKARQLLAEAVSERVGGLPVGDPGGVEPRIEVAGMRGIGHVPNIGGNVA